MGDKKKFKDWGIVKFLKANAPDLAGEVLSLAGEIIPDGGLLAKIGSKISSSNELKKEHKQEALLIMHEEAKMYLADVQDARKNETERDTSKFTSFLSKNIHEIIALVVIGSWISTWWNQPIIPTTEITGAVMLILGYLYGRTKPQS